MDVFAARKAVAAMGIAKVEGNEGLLTKILVRLPPKSVFRFMCVSKRWNNMISDPFFLKSYSGTTSTTNGRLLAFFEDRVIGALPISENLVMEDDLSEDLCCFINSSNGLVLFRCDFPNKTYHVYNPVTKKAVKLPLNPHQLLTCSWPQYCNKFRDYTAMCGLMCEQNTSDLVARYIVVQVRFPDDDQERDTIPIHTYSSETGHWVESTLVGTDKFCICTSHNKHPDVLNGAFHWYSWTRCNSGSENWYRSIAVYDPKHDNVHLQLIQLPYDVEKLKKISCYKLTRSAHNNILWFGFIEGGDQRMYFWMLPPTSSSSNEDYYKRSTNIPWEEWVLMYNISLDPLCNHMDSMLLSLSLKTRSCRCRDCRSPEYKEPVTNCLRGFIPWNPVVAVICRGGIIFLYNLETKSTEIVQGDDGRPISRYHNSTEIVRGPMIDSHYDTTTHSLRPYLESRLLSSYCL